MLKNSTTFRLLAVFLIFSSVLTSCKKNKHKVDTGDIDVNIEIKRYEDWIFSVNDANDYEQMVKQDTLFFKYYLNNIIGDVTGGNRVTDRELKVRGLKEFIQYKDMQDLYQNVKKEYEDLSDIEKNLSQAFTYYKYHFPDREVPSVVTFVSPFRSGIACFENQIGIGLDMFLGADFEPYLTPALGLPDYMIKKFRREYIVPNAVKAWLLSEFDPPAGKDRLLDKMVYDGKILYTMDALLPDTRDSIKIGYFKGQLEWNREYEFQIFDYINSKDLMFTSNERSFMGLIQDGPFSKGEGVPQEAPPRIAVWLGWQIVRAYMDQHPDLTLAQLWEEIDSEKILKESRYKP